MSGYKSKSTKGYIPYIYIEPKLIREHKEVDRYMDKLNITLPQEEFILKCLLSQSWKRRIIITDIELIEKEKSLGMTRYKFTLTAPNISISYIDSNPYKEEGWSKDIKSFEDRAWSVMNTFQNRL